MYANAASATVPKMQSITGLVITLGAAEAVVQVLQASAALACAGFVVWLWPREGVDDEYKFAGLALAILLASPYSYHYDLTVMGLAALWLALRIQREGWRPVDRGVLALAWLTPFFAVFAGNILGITIGPIVLLLLTTSLLRRVVRLHGIQIGVKSPPMTTGEA
jgi:hypothetical protein